MKKLISFCLYFWISTSACANEDQSIWISNTYQTDFGGSPYLAFLELQPRFNNDSRNLAQLIVRPFIGVKITQELQFWIGYAWQGEYSAKNKFDLATNDIIEQVQWVQNWTPALNFQYRFRLEQRFFEDADLSHRMRHRIRLQYTIPDTNIFLVTFDELFVYFNSVNSGRLERSVQAGINQNRTYFGIGYKFAQNINMDTGYQLQYVNNFGAEDLYNHVWLTNINVNF